MVPDSICTPEHGRSLWTNHRWTNFSPSYQLPLRSKGRLGHWCNLKLIYMGLRELRVAKSLVDFLSSVHLPRKSHASLSEWCASFHWHCWVDYIFRWYRHVSFVEWVASLRCPHFWALYIVHSLPYPSLFLSIPFLQSRPKAPSNSLPSSIRYFLSLFRFSAYSSFHPCLRLVA